MEERLSRVEWKAAIKTGLAAEMSLFLAFILTQWLQRLYVILSTGWKPSLLRLRGNPAPLLVC